jgi:hypothetical protein
VTARTVRNRCRHAARSLVALIWFVCAFVPVAHAGEEQRAASKRLFDEGRAALDGGDYALACQRFSESQQVEPRVGTLLNLALCYEKRAMLVQAHETWRTAEALATKVGDERSAVARQRANEMLPRVPLLTLTLEPGAPAGTIVRWTDSFQRDPKVVADSQLGKPFQVNAGTVRLFVEAPGREKRTLDLPVAEHDRTKLVVTVGPKLGEQASAPPTPPAATSDPAAPDQSPQSERDGGTAPLKITGFVVGGVGLVGLGVGAIFGGIAAAKKSKSEEPDDDGIPHCDDSSVCSPEGFDLREDAIRAATISTIGFVAGSVLTAAGVVMVLVAPDGSDGNTETGAVSNLRIAVSPSGGSLAFDF